MSENTDILALFHCPLEPIFTIKRDTEGKRVRFNCPKEYFSAQYREIASEIEDGFENDDDVRLIPIRPITTPDLSFTKPITAKQPFNIFNTAHKEIASRLITLLYETPDVPSLTSLAAFCRGQAVDPRMFQYCLSVAMQNRSDCRDLPIPTIAETFPQSFLDPDVIRQAREISHTVPMGMDLPIVVPLRTANDSEPEQRLAYFREDIGVNLHHWHWHLVYPGASPRNIVDKDRRGELFYYMHSQLIARYNIERMALKLSRAEPFNNFRLPIPEAYWPKLQRSVGNTTFPPRVPNEILRDLNRPETNAKVSELELWRDRIYEAIDKGYIVNERGEQIPLDEVRGIDYLGNIVENVPTLSINAAFYGNLHNTGHDVVAFSHDPNNRYLESFGVMGGVETAMRDPFFYRWHGFIDDLFRRHKNHLTPYKHNRELAFQGISVKSVVIESKKGSDNVIRTFMQSSEFNLGAGLDFGGNGNAFVRYTHLDHNQFTYKIKVINSGADRRGTVRIFIAPRVDENGRALPFSVKRVLMTEMDRFQVKLVPGQNNISRRSSQSSVTIPYNRTFRNISNRPRESAAEERSRFDFCGCGWPDHMLVPRGTTEGSVFDVFVMISDYVYDTVNETIDPEDLCSDSSVYCGIRDKKYPDRRAMGFPFDRIIEDKSLTDFVRKNDNMYLGQVTVKFDA